MTAGSAETGNSGRRRRAGGGRKAGGAPAEPGETPQDPEPAKPEPVRSKEEHAYHTQRAKRIKHAVRLELRGKYPNSPFQGISDPRKRAYLRAYAETAQRGLAHDLAGISRSRIYQPDWWDDPEFREALKLAETLSCDILEDEIVRRGVHGVEKPTGWYQGAAGGFVREYSDNLLMFRSKGAMPDKYKDRVELRGMLGTIDFARCTDEQIERMRAGEHPLAVLGSTPALLGQGNQAPNPPKDADEATP